MANDRTYALEVTNTPDADGDYRVNVLRDDSHAKTFFRKSRSQAAEEARAWIERDRTYDPSDVERIEVPSAPTVAPQSLRAS